MQNCKWQLERNFIKHKHPATPINVHVREPYLGNPNTFSCQNWQEKSLKIRCWQKILEPMKKTGQVRGIRKLAYDKGYA